MEVFTFQEGSTPRDRLLSNPATVWDTAVTDWVCGS